MRKSSPKVASEYFTSGTKSNVIGFYNESKISQ